MAIQGRINRTIRMHNDDDENGHYTLHTDIQSLSTEGQT